MKKKLYKLGLYFTILLGFLIENATSLNAQTLFQLSTGTPQRDVFQHIALLPDSGYFVVGNRTVAGIQQTWVYRINSLGFALSSRNISAGNGFIINSITPTSDGNFAYCGKAIQGTNEFATVGKLDINGNNIWSKVYASTGFNRANATSIAEAPNGDLVFTTNFFPFSGVPAINPISSIIRVGGNGAFLSSTLLALANTALTLHGVDVDANGIYVTGTHQTVGSTNTAISVGRFVTNLNLATTANTNFKIFDSPSIDRGNKIRRVGTELIVGANSNINDPSNTLCDPVLMRLNNQLNLINSNSYGGSQQDTLVDFLINPNGEITVLGITNTFGFGGSDLFLLNVATTGAIIWSYATGRTGPEILNSNSNALVKNAEGGFTFVAGTNQVGSTNIDGFITKVNGNGSSNCNTTAISNGVFSFNPTTTTLSATVGSLDSVDYINLALINTPLPFQDTTLCLDCNIIFNLGTPATACLGEDTILLDTGLPLNPTLWSTGATTSTLEVTQPGIYTVVVSGNGCSGADTVEVFFDSLSVTYPSDTVLCDSGFPFPITVNANSGSSFTWSNGATTNTIQITQADTFSILVANGACRDSSTVRIAERSVSVDLGNDTTLCSGQAILDALNPGALYLWSTGDTTQTLEVLESGIYSVEVNDNDCIATDEVEITVIENGGVVYFPTAFSPNGNGLNDVFAAVGNDIASISIKIYDRWGTLVAQSTNPDLLWNGTFNGEFAKNGIYNYIGTYTTTCGAGIYRRFVTGTVSLVR